MVLRTLGYWLLYATVGVVVLVMVVGGGGGDLGSEDARSPTRTRTKVLGVCSGIALGVAGLGAYLVSESRARQDVAQLLLGVGGPLAAVLVIWSWVWIARDLGRRRRRA